MKLRASRLLSVLMVLCAALALLPGTSLAAEPDLPDWYFLFAIFKNVDADCADGDGLTTHAVYTLPQEELDIFLDNARAFEAFMNQVGVMRAHVDIVEIDTTVTELERINHGSWISPEQAAMLLKDKVDLDQYDYVYSAVNLNVYTSYAGASGSPMDNGSGYACMNIKNREYALKYFAARDSAALYVHELLHFMEMRSQAWGSAYNLHGIRDKFYKSSNYDLNCLTDIILNQVEGDAETGTGVAPAAWQYSPRVLRTVSGLVIPEGVTSIGRWAFGHCASISSVSIPVSVTEIGYAAFYGTGLTDVYYGGTQAQWNNISFGEYNNALTRASIHYNSGGTTAAAPPAGISVTVSGTPVTWTDAEPFIDANNRTMVPLRAVADAMSLDVSWDAAAREAAFTDGSNTIIFPIGSTTSRTGGGRLIQMDTSAVIVSDRTYAPIRYLAEFFGCTVGWDAASKTVTLY